jgi:hypothetical protein
MTTHTPQRNVLLIGASRRILDQAIAALGDLGYTAQGTNEFFSDIPGQFDVTRLDMVTLGGAVPPDRKAQLKAQIAAINPKVIILDSLAGIPGLIVSQVQEGFAGDHQDPARAPAYTPGDRSIRLTLAEQAAVKVTVWWRTSIIPPEPKSDSLVLLDDLLASGDHTISVPDHVFQPPRRAPNSPDLPAPVFATVQVGAELYNFSIDGGQ